MISIIYIMIDQLKNFPKFDLFSSKKEKISLVNS